MEPEYLLVFVWKHKNIHICMCTVYQLSLKLKSIVLDYLGWSIKYKNIEIGSMQLIKLKLKIANIYECFFIVYF